MAQSSLPQASSRREPPWSVLPEGFEAIGCELGVADRVLNVLVPEIMLQGSRILAVVGQLVAACMPQNMCGCTRNGNAAASPVRASILRKPAGDIGARRSVVNTYRDGAAAHWSLRKAVGQPGDRLAKG